MDSCTECPSCHLAFFTPNHIALSPSAPVLRYIDEYLTNTAAADRLPLHEVFQLPRNLATWTHVNLPQDATPVLPYLDLFSLVILNPTGVAGLRIPAPYLPRPCSLRNGIFRPTIRMSRNPQSPSVLIFDAIAARNNTTFSHGLIPLSPEQSEFKTQRYWRLPIDTEIILATLINRVVNLPPQSPQAQTTEILLARRIFAQLVMSSDPGGGRGGGGNTGNATAGPSGKTRERGEPTRKKPRMEKRDTPNEGFGLGCFAEERVKQPSNQSLSSCERPHYGVNPKEWVVTTPFSTLADGEPQAKAYSGYLPSNRESDCSEDNPREWRFGPSFTSERIIATARQIMNM